MSVLVSPRSHPAAHHADVQPNAPPAEHGRDHRENDERRLRGERRRFGDDAPDMRDDDGAEDGRGHHEVGFHAELRLMCFVTGGGRSRSSRIAAVSATTYAGMAVIAGHATREISQ